MTVRVYYIERSKSTVYPLAVRMQHIDILDCEDIFDGPLKLLALKTVEVLGLIDIDSLHLNEEPILIP